MKRTTKFLVLVSGDADLARDHCRFSPEYSRIRDNDCAYLRVVECKHEDFKDNLVRIKDDDDNDDDCLMDFVEDVNGNLYYFDDYWTKTDVINAFE
jgi:hypothetical protein